MISESMQGPLSLPVVSQHDVKKKGAIQSLPEGVGILMFNMHLIKGPNLFTWSIKPYKEWFDGQSENKELVKMLVLKSAPGSIFARMFSFVIRGAYVFHSNDPYSLTSSYPDVAANNVIGGIGADLFKGFIDVKQFYLKKQSVLHATKQSAIIAQKIMQAFIDEQLYISNHVINHTNKISVLCPINLQVMVYPVKTACPSSNSTHTFEFSSLFDWLAEKDNTCPTCRRVVDIRELSFDNDVEQEVQNVVAKILIKMERILEKLPNNLFGSNLTKFDDPIMVLELSEMLKIGQAFLNGNLEEIVMKISHPDALSIDESYALSCILMDQMRPIKEKIDGIFEHLSANLRRMQMNEEISQKTYVEQDRKVRNWYQDFNFIPEECKIMKKLFSLENVIRKIQKKEISQQWSL